MILSVKKFHHTFCFSYREVCQNQTTSWSVTKLNNVISDELNKVFFQEMENTSDDCLNPPDYICSKVFASSRYIL